MYIKKTFFLGGSMKKISFMLLFFCLTSAFIPVVSYANADILEPTINARHAIVLDRNSKKAIYEKRPLLKQESMMSFQGNH